MNHEKLKKLSLKLVSNPNDWMQSFRKNIDMYISEKDITIRELSETSDINFETLKSFIYGDAKDCKLSTAVKLARALNVSIDELVGAETIEEETRKVIAMTRNLKEHHRKVIRMYAKHQYLLHGENELNIKYISVLKPECKGGYLKMTLIDEKYCVKDLAEPTQRKVGMGIKIPCDHYEPHFMKGEIILLGFDREGENNEKCVISHGGNIYICIKKIQFVEGKKEINYVAITNKKKVFSFDDIDDRFGYIVGWLEPDDINDPDTTYSWGER